MGVRDYAKVDERELREMRRLAPSHPGPRGLRAILANFTGGNLANCYGFRWLAQFRFDGCEYCGRKPRHKVIVVNPITLRREYHYLCRRDECDKDLRAWEGTADSRRRRAQWDWESEHPTVAARDLVEHIFPQYPSVSRATLRSFLESGADAATVLNSNGWTATALNGSIKSLGFADRVFAEVRSGQVTLRRIPGHA